MTPLILQVENTDERRAQSWAFHRSPVRIGRHPFNSLRLKQEFVSQWHAVVRFHGDRTTYLDLGSTNRTLIDGRPIEPNTEIDVTPETDVRIGNLRLHFIRDPNPPPDIPKAPTAHASLMEGTSIDVLGRTVVYPSRRPEPPASPQPAPAPAPQVPAAPSRAPDPSASAAAAHQRWRSAFRELLTLLQRELVSASESERRARAQDQLRRFPELAREEQYRECLAGFGLGDLLAHDASSWLRARIGGFFGLRPNEVPVTFERAGVLLDTFAEAFIGMRREHERMCAELALQRHVEQTIVQRTEDCHALLAYLLNPQVGVERLDELTRAMSDLAMHQVGILSGAIEGARAILEQLSPSTIAKAPVPPPSAEALEQESSWQRLLPHPSRELWRKYLHKYRDLMEGDQFTRELFGRNFARRYYALASSTGDGSALPGTRE